MGYLRGKLSTTQELVVGSVYWNKRNWGYVKNAPLMLKSGMFWYSAISPLVCKSDGFPSLTSTSKRLDISIFSRDKISLQRLITFLAREKHKAGIAFKTLNELPPFFIDERAHRTLRNVTKIVSQNHFRYILMINLILYND